MRRTHSWRRRGDAAQGRLCCHSRGVRTVSDDELVPWCVSACTPLQDRQAAGDTGWAPARAACWARQRSRCAAVCVAHAPGSAHGVRLALGRRRRARRPCKGFVQLQNTVARGRSGAGAAASRLAARMHRGECAVAASWQGETGASPLCYPDNLGRALIAGGCLFAAPGLACTHAPTLPLHTGRCTCPPPPRLRRMH